MASRAQDLGQGLLAFKAEAISVPTKERALKSGWFQQNGLAFGDDAPALRNARIKRKPNFT
jgi:hypothetical protein